MNILNIKMMDIIPSFMRDDRTVRGLCAAGDAMYDKLISAVHIAWWRKYIDDLDAGQLDVIAKQIGIPWYDDAASLVSKRKVLKNYENVLAIAGTPDAVRFAVKDLFGEVEIVEWHSYNGAPYHFKLLVNAKLTDDNMKRFASAIADAKNVRSIMDSLETMRISNVGVYMGAAFTNTYVCEIK